MKRAGMTLIETTLAIAVAAAIFAGLSVMIVRVMRVERQTRDFLQYSLALTQLSDQFVADVRLAIDAQLLNDATQGIRLTTAAGDRIEYVWQADEIVRSSQAADGSSHRESYRLRRGDRVQWSIDELSDKSGASSPPGRFVTLEVRSAEGSLRCGPIVANLGRDLQLSTSLELRLSKTRAAAPSTYLFVCIMPLIGLQSRRSTRRRGGFILAAALIVMTVVTLATAAMIVRLSATNRIAQRRQQQIQADWLTNAAIDRAHAQLSADPQFSGEDWIVSAESMNGKWPARIKIEVLNASESTVDSTRRIRITTLYGEPEERRILHTKVVAAVPREEEES